MIRFTKVPTGRFLLAYDLGETARLGNDLEDKLIQEGYAVAIQEETSQSKSWGLQSNDPEPIEGEVIPVGDDGRDGSGRRDNRPDKRRRTRN